VTEKDDFDDFVFDAKHDFNSFVEKKEDQGVIGRLTNSWVIMAVCAMLSFASANLLTDQISPLGIDAIDYYNTGALVFCSFYLLKLRCSGKKTYANTSRSTGASEGMLDINVSEYRDLLYKRDGKLDTRVLVLIVMASFLTCAMFLSVSFTYALAGRAGMNIGLAQTVWGTTPFFGALLDWYINNVRVPRYQAIGMVCILGCVAIMSL
jgi:drug/metabolite transporter (DMT)-like permease